MRSKKQTIGSVQGGVVKALGNTNYLNKEVVIGMVHH